MANQYSNNFKAKVEKLYKKPVELCLKGFVDDGLTYVEVAKLTGFQSMTVRNWCRRYNLKLKGVIEAKDEANQQAQLATYWTEFKSPKLNKSNLLSRAWG